MTLLHRTDVWSLRAATDTCAELRPVSIPDRGIAGYRDSVELVFGLTVPAVVVLLVVFWTYDKVQQRRGRRQGTPLSSTYLNEFTAVFHATKRTELEHRESVSLIREEDPQGAPPLGVDLDRGVAVFPPGEAGSRSSSLRSMRRDHLTERRERR